MVTDRPRQEQNYGNFEGPVSRTLFTYDETAKIIGCSPRQVFTLRKKGQLPATLIGGSVKFHIDTINAFIRRQTEGSN